ncbi:NAD(P)-dependent dehydrogenase, short-chain alcohol dehydrogenase family [Abditibacterium utsteinense]|uniref:NAD(P)-dependent dehydrogenase, short-chain alcohol dehydrogenase family n=1 Tax=Abditibacterium utsteinense TaxID=1960156 RepID=A0A2S8SR65_9BACT|nr:glucose 1-dehydrogenase [Abditibacterium utsteinense]PQV63275.1 NAD(P)-dependent dehydrogenase, short-chain alcohol dehydrogenase family [Abditibacterium utsteinense]
MSDFQNRVAVVTGGVKGIGAACVRALIHEGARVAVLDMDEAVGAELCAELGDKARFFPTDVSRGSAVEAAFEAIRTQLGAPTLLVNNAGIQHYGTVTETSEEEWDRVLGINLKSLFLCSRAAIPSMLESGGGAIVNMASVQSFVSQARVAPYTTSKTAILGLTRSIAIDYAPRVRCNAVCPGSVDTPMLRNAVVLSPDPQAVLDECRAGNPLGRIGTPEEIADLVLFLLSDKAAFITGQAIRIDGGLGLETGGSKRD